MSETVDKAALNRQCVRTAMEALYSTYIVEDDVAMARGEAIRALDRFAWMVGERYLANEWDGRT